MGTLKLPGLFRCAVTRIIKVDRRESKKMKKGEKDSNRLMLLNVVFYSLVLIVCLIGMIRYFCHRGI